MSVSKSDIFDLFYEQKEGSRSGGGKMKKKTRRRQVNFNECKELENKISKVPDKFKQKLLKYYEELKNRNPDIAPPPKPGSFKKD